MATHVVNSESTTNSHSHVNNSYLAQDAQDIARLYDIETEPPSEDAHATAHIDYYMRLRKDDKNKYLEHLAASNKHKFKKKIEDDLVRIEKLRLAFFTNPTKRTLIEDHNKFRSSWRDEAKRNTNQNREELRERRRKIDQPKSQDANLSPGNGKGMNRCWRLFESRARPEESSSRCEEEDKVDKAQEEAARKKQREIFENEDRVLLAIRNWVTEDLETNTPFRKEAGSAHLSSYNVNASIMDFPAKDDGRTTKYANRYFSLIKEPIAKLLEEGPERSDMLVDERHDRHETPNKLPIRYIHLPTNNMLWVEKFLKRFYSDVEKDRAGNGPAERLLAYHNWEGQIHGGAEHPVHARHMRSRCSTVQGIKPSPNTSQSPRLAADSFPTSPMSQQTQISRNDSKMSELDTSTENRNFSIFMPYLHWEINTRQIEMTEIVAEVRREAKKPIRTKHTCQDEQCRKDKEKKDAEKMKRFERDWQRMQYLTWFEKKHGDLPKKCSKHLGNYLLSIAKIAEAMEFEDDERLIREYLPMKKSPLHVRRTLDQSYFWTLQDTKSRDRDQVVYRGTRGNKRPPARIVMVDQLWMWILDERTILTSFPRRVGKNNKTDPSGVHKSLQDRLSTGEDRVRSVFDLALIIIDQCSRVFFDRTKPSDNRPEVMDIFGNAVASLTHKKTLSYEQFWVQAEIYLSTSTKHSRESAHTYLNINPEGALLKEGEDIIEELHMMGRAFTQQIQVVKDFKKSLDNLNGNFEVDGQPGERQDKLPHPRVAKHTIIAAEELLEHIEERLKEITDLEGEARRTVTQLHNLLTLKQQQASIIEARLALDRADQSNSQGRTVLLFTLVTLFFLPMSFLTSLFGMENSTWAAAPMDLHKQITYTFAISFSLVVPILLLAFNKRSRTLLRTLLLILYSRISKLPPANWFIEPSPMPKIDSDYSSYKAARKRISDALRKPNLSSTRNSASPIVRTRTITGASGMGYSNGDYFSTSEKRIEESSNYV